MSNSFVNSQLFSSSDRKESYIKTNLHTYAYYSSVLEGKISWTEWQELSPKEREYAIDCMDEIRKIQSESFKKKQEETKRNKN